MEAIVLGVVTETRASNATKEDAAEGVDVFQIPQTEFSVLCLCLTLGLVFFLEAWEGRLAGFLTRKMCQGF